jgi:hypothetical protein
MGGWAEKKLADKSVDAIRRDNDNPDPLNSTSGLQRTSTNKNMARFKKCFMETLDFSKVVLYRHQMPRLNIPS